MPPVKLSLPSTGEEQARNLKIVAAVAVLFLIALTSLGAALYLGAELPPHDVRTYQTTPDGYAAPPRPTEVVPAGTVARGSRAYAAPGEVAPNSGMPVPSLAVADRWTNPLRGRADAAEQGKHLYSINCVMCHGEPGSGKPGNVGEAYTPKPPDLGSPRLSMFSGGRLYYRITYGIESTPTAESARYLPRDWHAFGPLLRPEERWGIVTYLQQQNHPNAP